MCSTVNWCLCLGRSSCSKYVFDSQVRTTYFLPAVPTLVTLRVLLMQVSLPRFNAKVRATREGVFAEVAGGPNDAPQWPVLTRSCLRSRAIFVCLTRAFRTSRHPVALIGWEGTWTTSATYWWEIKVPCWRSSRPWVKSRVHCNPNHLNNSLLESQSFVQ